MSVDGFSGSKIVKCFMGWLGALAAPTVALHSWSLSLRGGGGKKTAKKAVKKSRARLTGRFSHFLNDLRNVKSEKRSRLLTYVVDKC